MKKASNIVVKILGILLLIAAVLKGRQLLTEPVANSDIWSYRPLLILMIEFELALAIWLLSGLFKKAAWLAGLMCFSAFSAVTLYKAVTGAESCGCFGSVHVNPWITLFAIDLPAVTALSIFRPRLSFTPALSFLRKQESIKNLIKEFLTPLPSAPRFAMTAFLAIAILGISAPILAFNEPAMVTASYEVLEPKTWVGKELPILEHIDIAESLTKGTWLVLLYHYDCPDCRASIEKCLELFYHLKTTYERINGALAFINMPPYGDIPVGNNSAFVLGKLGQNKEWFVTTPTVVLVVSSKVEAVWDKNRLDWDDIFKAYLRKHSETSQNNFSSFEYQTHTLSARNITM